MPSNKYRLTYFPMKGRAELIRLIFRVARVPFEDRRISFADWKEFKSKTPSGTLPVLEIDGKMFAESGAISHWAARKFGLMGKTDADELRTEAILIQATELRDTYISPLFTEKDSYKVESLSRELVTAVDRLFKTWEATVVQTESNGGKLFSHMVTHYTTAADLAVLYVADLVESYIQVDWARFPRLQAVLRTVSDLPPLRTYLNHRDKAQAKTAVAAATKTSPPASTRADKATPTPRGSDNTPTVPDKPQSPQTATKPHSSQSKLPGTPRLQATPRSHHHKTCSAKKGSAIVQTARV